MYKDFFITILIIIIDIIILSIIYIGVKQKKRNNSITFIAKILEIKIVDGVYTLLVKVLCSNKYPIKFFLDINEDTKIIENHKNTDTSSLRINQIVTITSSNIIMPSNPARLAHVTKIVINNN